MTKINRTQNATKNILFGVIKQIYQLLIPFVIRTAMIYKMGTQYVGLGSLFTSILSVLNLTELGIGSAMIYSMYKPIVEDDTEKICKLMNLYKLYYRVIGTVIMVVGVALTPLIPKLVTGSVPSDIDLLILYYINLGTTVLSYFMFSLAAANSSSSTCMFGRYLPVFLSNTRAPSQLKVRFSMPGR